MKQKGLGLDVSSFYEEALTRLHDIKYMLHIQDRQDEALKVGEAIEHLKQAYELSKL